MPIALPFVCTEPIRTDRLLLRPLTGADVDAVFDYQSRADVCENLLYSPRDRQTVEQKVLEYGVRRELAKDGDFLELGITLAPDPTVIGQLYFALESVEHQTAEIGWTMNPKYHRQGIATEAAKALVNIAFAEIGLHRLVANLNPGNTPSERICLRLGMRLEALHRKDMWIKGQWADTATYAILAEDWQG